MAKVILSHPFDEIHGALGKNEKIINRQKKYRDDRGRIIMEGKQEAYVMKHPRDFKKNPPKGAELANQNCWLEACRRASQILFVASLDQLSATVSPEDLAAQQEALLSQERFHRQFNNIPDFYTLAEARALLAEYKARYQAQLPNTRGKHPDPQTPIDPISGTARRYAQFPAFLRAILYHTLKSNSSTGV
ncbi:MAG: hypothetical protein IJ776_02015 [Paludibacteraceae bacterium]|nr:hypothetical protein [Paludibacteraceae bacterium]